MVESLIQGDLGHRRHRFTGLTDYEAKIDDRDQWF